MSITTRQEKRLRLAASKQGLRIIKSRLRTSTRFGFGFYDLRRLSDNLSAFGCHPGKQPTHTLSEIAIYLLDNAAPMSRNQQGNAIFAADRVARRDRQERERQAA